MTSVTSVPFGSVGEDAPGRGDAAALESPRSPAPRPRLLDAALVVVALGFGLTVGVTVTAESSSQLSAPGGVTMLFGNVTGLVGTYLALVMVLLVSRLPFVERILGQDGLLRWHRKLSPWPITLIVLHAVLLTVAYAQATHSGIGHQLAQFISSYAGMLTAIIGFAVMVVVSVVSIHQIRRRLRRETWWAIHLGMYLAFALAFSHEVLLGPSFVGHPLTQAVWSVAWAATAGLVLAYRFGLPLVRSLRHGVTVHGTKLEADGVTSVICTGRNLERLAVSGGQFFEWRFLQRKMWWQAHPYTLSARPRPPYLRLTVKAVGDHSRAVGQLKPGTRVIIEGPYGAFTAHAKRNEKVAIVAGGVGITSARALLEDLGKRSAPIVVLRASTAADVALADEVRSLVEARRGTLHVLVGSRDEVPIEKVLKALGDLRRRDVYLSGSESFVVAMEAVLRTRGVAPPSLHSEVYAL